MFRKWMGAIFGHARIKFFALLISLGIWIYAHSRVTQQIGIMVPVTVTPPANQVLLFQSARNARITLAGPNWLMTKLESGPAGRNLRLSHKLVEDELADGWADLTIGAGWLQSTLPNAEAVQVDFQSVEPEKVRVFVSPEEEVALPVRVRTSGVPAAGFQLTQDPVAAPSEVTVRGPAIALAELDAVETDVIPIWGLRSDHRREPALKNEVEVTLPNGEVVPVQLELSVATVVANVYVSGEKEEERAFPNVPVEVRQPADFPYTVRVPADEDEVTVVVRAAPQELARLKPGSVAAFVNVRSLATQEIAVGDSVPFTEQVVGDLPSGIRATVVRVEPASITLTLRNPPQSAE